MRDGREKAHVTISNIQSVGFHISITIGVMDIRHVYRLCENVNLRALDKKYSFLPWSSEWQNVRNEKYLEVRNHFL